MINNNSYYKSEDLLNDNIRVKIGNFFNPYGYNLESNFKDKENTDIVNQKSKSHSNRNNNKNKIA